MDFKDSFLLKVFLSHVILILDKLNFASTESSRDNISPEDRQKQLRDIVRALCLCHEIDYDYTKNEYYGKSQEEIAIL